MISKRSIIHWTVSLVLAVAFCLLTTIPVDAVQTVYIKTARTGGGANALDGINGSSLNDADVAFVIETDQTLFYENDASCSDGEDDPLTIIQDTNPGTNCFKLKGVMSGVSVVSGATPYTISALNSSGLKLTEDSGVSGIFIADTGYVGIGTDTPAYPLDVSDPNDKADLSISGTTRYADLLFRTQSTTRAALYAYEPNGETGNSLFQVVNQMNNGQIRLDARNAAGTPNYFYFYGSDGSFRQNANGTTHYFGPGTASIFEDSTGELYACDDSGNCTLLTSHDQETNLPVFYSTNNITGEGQKINIGQFFQDAAAGKFESGFKSADVAKYATFTPPSAPEVVRNRLLAKEAKERESWKQNWIQRNTINVKGVDGKEFFIQPTDAEAETAAVQGYKVFRPKWLSERTGLVVTE